MKLSVCMIVKNEELVLKRCLSCVEKFADEIIVVDTGSNDKSVSIAKKFTQNVYEIKWENSFCKARNYSYSKATGDYIMWVDADDYISDENISCLNKLKNDLDGTVDCVFMTYIDYSEEGFSNYILRDRIIKRSLNAKWVYDVHECIVIKDSWKLLHCPEIEIVHKKERINEKNRNISIFEGLIEKGEILSDFELMTKISEKILKLGNRAVKKAQENNRKNGIPNVYCINGKLVFELPNGEITTKYNFS